MTVRQAINTLYDAGLVYRRHGVGTFVSYVKTGETINKPLGFAAMVRSQRLTPRSLLLSLSFVPCPQDVAEALVLPARHPMVRIERLRSMDDLPVALEASFLSEDLGDIEWEGQDWSSISLTGTLRSHGLEVVRSIDQVSACSATEGQSAMLDITPGSALLEINQVGYSHDGTPLLYTLSYYRPDRRTYVAMRSR